ncbi:MAG TPA: beta-lactamase family protein [Candidatus Avipropionibacterium avicola]|uniref:Beta-lactamase family protein n=1 Tax=Candidatus Avipropionibacterium avicola TaxID=2840701 RepID=A0A9D1H006_9ACTN|nr:beta-lactamase family protein [Candidatus Avipropionibacterium avicola]
MKTFSERLAGLDRTLARITRRRSARSRGVLPAPQVFVRAPDWHYQFGDPGPFHAASAGKLMTATLIAQLVEHGDLGFESCLAELLPATIIQRLSQAEGVDMASAITVEHLLTQTSGLPDYFETRRGHDTAASIRGIARDRDHQWSPTELLDEAARLPSDGPPGVRYRYSDTNWVLLGLIAEQATGTAFATLLRERIFGPCEMIRASTPYDPTLNTDLAALEIAPFWLGRHELSRAASVSLDWAGGNIVTTPLEWAQFLRCLADGTLVSPTTLDHLTRTRNRFRPGIHYGAGTMTIRFDQMLPLFARGLPHPIGHVGVWATHAFWYPHLDAQVVLNFHSDRAMQSSFLVHLQIARLLAS